MSKNNTKRCFISIDPPEHIKKEIEKIQKVLPKFIGNKIKQKNLHLTLKFLGNINEEQIELIKKKLSEIKFKKFTCKINKLGVFSEKFIRIIWLNIIGIDNFQKIIDKKLSEIGFEKGINFKGHITIARVKIIKNKSAFLRKINKINIPELEFNIKSFELKESVLNQKSPIYKTIQAYS